MKTITLEVGYFDGEHILLSPERLAKYPDDNKRVLTVQVDRLKSGTVMDADAALNRRPELVRQSQDGSPVAGIGEAFQLARSWEILSRIVKSWEYRTKPAEGEKAGTLTESLTDFSEQSLRNEPMQIVLEIASRAEFPRLPTPEALAKEGEGLTDSTKSS